VRSGPAQPGADTADVAHDWGIPGLTRDHARAEAGPPPDVTATDATAPDASVKDTA
jgi:alpha-methylacyl-CoA racemase